MKRIILIFIILFLGIQNAFGLEVVYPKKNNVQINAPSTFFIGNTYIYERLMINGEYVPTVLNGGFAHTVLLNYGENTFEIKSGNDTLIYKITRPKPSQTLAKPVLKNLSECLYITNRDNSTLRSTPSDYGINRLSQLPIGTNLIINGEYKNFYRVKLSNSVNGWISKSDVKKSEQNDLNVAEIKQLWTKHDLDYTYYRFEISKKIPFSILNQDEKLVLKFYNTDKVITVEKENIIGFSYYYEDNNIFVLKVRDRKPIRPTITIDAGHGGVERGAIGCCGDNEKNINLKIAKYLKEELKFEYKVVMTREDDIQVPLQKRVDIAKNNNSLILISIHANALPDGENPNLNRGTSVYYYHKQAKPLAESILREVTETVGTNNDRVRQKSLALVRPTDSVSVLVEVAYMINPYDNMMLTDDDFQKNAAKAIANGIRKYLNEN